MSTTSKNEGGRWCIKSKEERGRNKGCSIFKFWRGTKHF